jgi:hypothetical protein
MIMRPILSAMFASGLIVPEKPKFVLPKPAIVCAQSIEFSRHMLAMPFTMGMLPGKAKSPLDIVYADNTFSASNLTTYGFTGRSIGPADSTRIVIVGVAARAGSTFNVSSVSIAGAAATLIARTIGNDDAAAIYARALASGTTADISVTFSTSAVRCGIGVWAMYNKSSTTPHASSTANNGSGTLSAAVPENGGAVAIFFDDTGTSKTTYHSRITNNFNVLISDNNSGRYYGASGDGATAGNATFSINAAGDNAGAIATWASDT